MTKDALRAVLKPVPIKKRLAVALAVSEVKQQHIADRCGLSEDLVSRIVRGRREPTANQRKDIARVLGVPADELFGKDSSEAVA